MKPPSHQPPAALIQRVQKACDKLLLVDRERLQNRTRRIQQRLHQRQPVDRLLRELETEFARATKRWQRRGRWRPKLQLPKNLPITSHRAPILQAIQNHQVVIVTGDTGSGKTTQLPKLALLAGRGRLGRIGSTQPRRLAAVSMACRVAEELHGTFGRQIGCQVRFNDRTTDDTVVKFMTDGILLAETLQDPMLWQYDTLIIDEAHERTLNIDFILGYLKNLLPKRCDLKIVISSATLDAEAFSAFFDRAPVMTVQGRMYPIEDVFLPPHDPDEELTGQVTRAVHWVNELDPRGDILVFLPGEREIREAADKLRGRRYPNTEILPLFARLSLSEQQRVFSVGGRRRIVLATNVAETSITIPGIRYVIDSGLVRLSRYYPRRQVQALQIEQVSQASARQRRGRCGRLAEGVCVHLYSEETLNDSAPFADPEIRRSSLAGVILQMAVLRLTPIENFPFLDSPQKTLVRQGYETLIEIGALDSENRLTPLGRELAEFPVDPQVARMIVQARAENVLSEVLLLAAVLSIRDPRERPSDQESIADQAHRQWHDERSDFTFYLRLWNAWRKIHTRGASKTRLRKWCKTNYLSYRRMLEWQNLFRELADIVATLRWKVRIKETVQDDAFYHLVHRSILAGIPMHIGLRGESMEYQGTRDRRFYIFPGSGLFQSAPPWVMVFSLVETAKLYARTVAVIRPEWLEQVAPHLCSPRYADIHWEIDQGFVYALESMVCGGLVVVARRRVHYGRVRPDVARELFIREGMVPGNLHSQSPWLKSHRQLLDQITSLEQKIRRPHSLFHEQAVFDHFDMLIPEDICSTKALDRWLYRNRPKINVSMEEAMVPQIDPITPEDYPDQLRIRGHTFELRYRYAPDEIDDGMILRCPERLLSALPAWAPDWLVPGWLPEKVRLLIRSLPKDLRTDCNPVYQTVDQFMDQLDHGALDRDQPLLDALAGFLSLRLGRPTDTTEFDATRLPEHLVMKIAVVDDANEVIQTLSEKPKELGDSSQLDAASSWMPKEWFRSGLTEWD